MDKGGSLARKNRQANPNVQLPWEVKGEEVMPCPHNHVAWHEVPSSKKMGICTGCGLTVGYQTTCYGCGETTTNVFEVQYQREIRLCDNCKFKHTVARAAGREDELLAGLYRSERSRTNWQVRSFKYVNGEDLVI